MTQVMDTETFLEHHGVKGMKWGVHKKARPSDADIKSARLSVRAHDAATMNKAVEVATSKKGTAKRAKAEKDLKSLEMAHLKNPDRITATRLTKGEKIFNTALIVATGPIGLTVVGAQTAVNAGYRRTASKRQASGHYDRKR